MIHGNRGSISQAMRKPLNRRRLLQVAGAGGLALGSGLRFGAAAGAQEIDEEIIDVSWGATDESSLESLLASAQALDGLNVEARPVVGSNRLLRVLETCPA